jgi:hypothetical protein
MKASGNHVAHRFKILSCISIAPRAGKRQFFCPIPIIDQRDPICGRALKRQPRGQWPVQLARNGGMRG